VKHQDNSTVDCYDKQSNAYDIYQTTVVPHYQDMLDIVSSTCRRYLSPNSRILDLGCGTGNASLAVLKKMPARIFLIDGSPSMMAVATDKISTFFPEALSGSKVVNLFRDNWSDDLVFCQDAIISTLVLEHLPLQIYGKVVEKCFDILVPGGWLMTVEGYEEEGSDMIQWFNEEMQVRRIGLDSEISSYIGELRNNNEIHYYTSKRQKETFWKNIGFEKVNIIWQYLCLSLMIGNKPKAR
jgi:tRNA (cmo5U34)-methyltransferase